MKINILRSIVAVAITIVMISCTSENRNSSIGKEDSVHGRTHNGNIAPDTNAAPADNTSNVEADTTATSPQP